MKTRVIMDSDIGDDIDDALALAYATKVGQCELVAVTTVYKNTHKRAQIAAQFLSTIHREDIPVYAGCGQPLKSTLDPQNNPVDITETPPQFFDFMQDAQYQKDMDAVEFLYQHYMTESEPASLLTIGCLTNIATLISKYPNVVAKIPHIYLMGGSYYNYMNEWNIECDPEAARIVFESGITLYLIGLDVTTQCVLSEQQLNDINLDDKSNSLLMNMTKEWIARIDRDGVKTPILHDPLALHALLKGDVFFQPEVVKIELDGEFTRGTTFVEPYRLWGSRLPETPHNVAYAVNNEKVVNEIYKTIFH